MRPDFEHIRHLRAPPSEREHWEPDFFDGGTGGIFYRGNNRSQLKIVASTGGGWEHVSVSRRLRIPTWGEMCKVKDLFWLPEEAVVQIHPPRSEYVNFHETCLHLWKPVGREVELPPTWMVGPVNNLQPQGARGLTGIRR